MRTVFAAAALLFVAIRAEEEASDADADADAAAAALLECTEALVTATAACTTDNEDDADAMSDCIAALTVCSDSGSIYISAGAAIVATAALLM